MKKLLFPIALLCAVILLSSCSSSDAEVADTVSNTASITEDSCDTETFYHNGKLYEYTNIDYIYEGELENLDRSLLSGYEFIGVAVASETDEQAKKELASSAYDNVPILYNSETDNFIAWEQEDNYWLKLTKFPEN